MRLQILLVLFMTIPVLTFGQWDPIQEFNNRKFPCDTGYTTLEINFCSGYKNQFADSLLNKLYKKILKSIDQDNIETTKEFNKLKLVKKKTSADSTYLETLEKNIDQNKRLKASIISSQRIWLKLRQANSDIVYIFYEGGTGQTAFTIQADTEEILERIKKLQKLYSVY